jgi:ankyrin repeat protein
MNKSFSVVAVCLSIICTSCSRAQDKKMDGVSNVSSNDYELFADTPIWPLAQAVKSNDTLLIKYYCRVKKMDINYAEKKFGNTLLMLTVTNRQYNSCRTLLTLGADVNKHDTFNGTSAIIDAASINDNSLFLKLLIRYGANPNDVEVGPNKKGNYQRFTPLIKASSTTISNTEVLVEAGAAVNYTNEYHVNPLNTALVSEKYDIALYLLKKGADYKSSILVREGKPIFITTFLKENALLPKSRKYLQQKEVISFLKGKGVLI